MRRAVRNLFRVIAAGIILFGGVAIGLEWLRHRVNEAAVRPMQWLIGGGLIFLGILLFALSSGLAERFTDDDDDETGGPDIDIPAGED